MLILLLLFALLFGLTGLFTVAKWLLIVAVILIALSFVSYRGTRSGGG